jgi:hypothetical protein
MAVRARELCLNDGHALAATTRASYEKTHGSSFSRSSVSSIIIEPNHGAS